MTLNDPNDFYDHKSLYEDIFSKYKAQLVLDPLKKKMLFLLILKKTKYNLPFFKPPNYFFPPR